MILAGGFYKSGTKMIPRSEDRINVHRSRDGRTVPYYHDPTNVRSSSKLLAFAFHGELE